MDIFQKQWNATESPVGCLVVLLLGRLAHWVLVGAATCLVVYLLWNIERGVPGGVAALGGFASCFGMDCWEKGKHLVDVAHPTTGTLIRVVLRGVMGGLLALGVVAGVAYGVDRLLQHFEFGDGFLVPLFLTFIALSGVGGLYSMWHFLSQKPQRLQGTTSVVRGAPLRSIEDVEKELAELERRDGESP